MYRQNIPDQEKLQYGSANRKRNRLLYILPGALISIILGLFVMAMMNTKTPVPGIKRTENPEGPMIIRTIFRGKPEMGLSPEAVQMMLKDKGLFDSRKNPSGTGLSHTFEVQHGGTVVYDHASGLMWQRSGSRDDMNYEKTGSYIFELNRQQFAGYNDWRLPTLEEAVSLMESTKKNGDLYIDQIFNLHQVRIWTSDFRKNSMVWVVRFDSGYCDYAYNDGNINYSVRAVR